MTIDSLLLFAVVGQLLVSPPLAKQEVTGPKPVNNAVVKNNGNDAVVLSASGFHFRERPRKWNRVKQQKQQQQKNKNNEIKNN